MKILGINLNHISSAALLVNGKLAASSPEERFTRNKLTREFPYNSIKFCLSSSGLKLEDLDAITIGWNPAINLETYKKAFSQTYRWFPELLYTIPNNLFNLKNLKSRLYVKQDFYSFNKKKNLSIYYINHHLCHGAQSFLNSGFNKAGILTMDGFGEKTSTMWAMADKQKIVQIDTQDFPQSLGSFYETVTEYLGFKPDSDEWKVMGMAAYGDKRKFEKKFNQILKIKKNYRYEIDLNYFEFFNFDKFFKYSKKFEKLFKNIKKNKNNKINKKHYDFASSAQAIFEQAVFNAFDYFKNKSVKNICLGGGSMMNCLSNGKLAYKYPNKNIYVTYAPDDGGLAIGSALYASRYIFKEKIHYKSIIPNNGISFSEKHIRNVLNKYKIKFMKSKNVISQVVQLLAEKKVVGWFQEKAEFGQRALGFRSIIADPSVKNMKDIVNKKIKYREVYRPFAPAALPEDADKFFYIPKNIDPTHMQFVVKAKPNAKKHIPAVVHNDNTARIQVVKEIDNPKFFSLIKKFKEKQGFGVLLNTSFNLKGEPIVNSPEDAIRTFYTSGLDALCIGNHLIVK